MLRKDRERDAAFAWEVFQKAPYATLSLTDEVGKPYAIPISPVVDEAYHVVYFHCAGHGEKWELLAKNPPVCLSAVSYAAAIPNEFSMAYASAALHGRAEVVTDEAEQVKAMLLLLALCFAGAIAGHIFLSNYRKERDREDDAPSEEEEEK